MISRKLLYELVLICIFSFLCIFFVYNDYFLYDTPILKITKLENKETKNDGYYNQNITGIIQNGKFKGKVVSVTNSTSISGVYDEQIHENSELFLKLSEDENNINRITGIKRDKYIVILLVIFIDLIILVSGFKGVKTLLSLIVNIIITILSIRVFSQNIHKINLLFLYIIISIIFISSSLFITNGKSKKTLSAIISSIISLFISFSFCYILVTLFGKNISIWTMDFIEVVYDYKNYFLVSILLCGLGAIMDISITISSSLSELIEKDNKILKSSLIKSGKEISKDIIGTMINVMLFTCFTEVIPIIFLAMKNSVTMASALNIYASLELIIVLCSSISIVVTILVSLSICILIYRRKEVQK